MAGKYKLAIATGIVGTFFEVTGGIAMHGSGYELFDNPYAKSESLGTKLGASLLTVGTGLLMFAAYKLVKACRSNDNDNTRSVYNHDYRPINEPTGP